MTSINCQRIFVFILFGFIIFVFLYNNVCHAQQEPAYEKIKIGLQYTNNFNRNKFHNSWNPENGLKGFVETPFYLGRFQIGLKKIDFEPLNLDIPETKTWFIYIGWGKEFSILHHLKFYSGLNIGNFQMHFEDEKTDEGLRDESEMGIELTSRLSYQIFNNSNLNIEGSYLRILTNKKINLFFLSVGFDYSFKSPEWLKDFLR